MLRKKINDRDRPLIVQIEGNELVMRIGISTLAHSAEHCPALYDGTVENCDPPYCKVYSELQAAKDIAREMLHEREDGSSPLSDLFDACVVAAIEDGAEGFYCEEQPHER